MQVVRDEFEAQLEKFVPGLIEQHPELRGFLSKAEMEWSYDMYHSRRFPVALCSWLDPSVHAQEGVMLPLLDLMNHQQGTAIQWEAGDEARR